MWIMFSPFHRMFYGFYKQPLLYIAIVTVHGRLTSVVATKYITYIILVYFMFGASSLARKLNFHNVRNMIWYIC